MQVENRLLNRQTKERIIPTFKLNFIKKPKLLTSYMLIEKYLFYNEIFGNVQTIQSHLHVSIKKLR